MRFDLLTSGFSPVLMRGEDRCKKLDAHCVPIHPIHRLSNFHPSSLVHYPSLVPHWQKVTLVGVGLLGGSIGLALRQRQLAARVVGYVRRTPAIAECEQAGAVDKADTDLRRAVEGADLVILCTPLAQMAALTSEMLPALKRGSIVTDVGSVKGSMVAELEPLVAASGAQFIGSHPMAGAEKMGVHQRPRRFV